MSRRYSSSVSWKDAEYLVDVVYNHLRNDFKFYQFMKPVRWEQEVALRANTYSVKNFVKEYGDCVDRRKPDFIDQLADQLTDYNDGDESEAKLLRLYRISIAEDAGKYLEEYYRTELCLHFKLPMVHSKCCEACKKPMTFAMYACDRHCSEACYETLFDKCRYCKKKNMTCVTNKKTPFIPGARLEKACDACLLKKYKLSIVCISTR